ncbi:biopolymer transport protein ExbD [Neorhodopirellula lusitana]|uniref:Biopolymer transport protein ExbD n=1 Tax=Neorhodopirellula lusitana TaxID=445327 RepID=A0ABY1PUF0_9BACT|nr:biopolymer transport protein ExbD [Neorhodopirellula lusitana]
MRSPSNHLTGNRRTPDRVTMTPMIDVVFLLIIFFLVSSHLSRRENRLPVSLANAQTGAMSELDDAGVTLTLDAERRLYLAGKEIRGDSLRASLGQLTASENRRGPASPAIRLRVDRSLAYEHLERLLGVLTELGIDDVAIVTSPSPVRAESEGRRP